MGVGLTGVGLTAAVQVQYIDTYEVTQLGQAIGGDVALAQFTRLLDDLPEQDSASQVTWTLKGERDMSGQRFLQLHVHASPRLTCQRCLAPLEWPIQSDTRLLLVNSEAALEVDSPDDESAEGIERIVGARRFDVLALVEDELILCLPYVPKHEVCPSSLVALPEQDEPPTEEHVRPSPFAVLGKLKKD
ncbi:Large ribosomal RNA subunit accumulation protein YceD OS=Eoetvoesiella caeni OX=645616 GN=DFR37_101597 PE=3 SV=1 [Eoetvoesiella caeni]